jgi:hypothetical protein
MELYVQHLLTIYQNYVVDKHSKGGFFPTFEVLYIIFQIGRSEKAVFPL